MVRLPISKTVGLVDVLRHLLGSFEKRITCAFIYGSVASGQERSESDIDLMVMGRATRFDLAKVSKMPNDSLLAP